MDATQIDHSVTFDEYIWHLASQRLHFKEDGDGRLVITRYRNSLTVSEDEFIARQAQRQNQPVNAGLHAQEAIVREAQRRVLTQRLHDAIKLAEARVQEVTNARQLAENAAQLAAAARATLDAVSSVDIAGQIRQAEADILAFESNWKAKQLAYAQEKQKVDAAAQLLAAQQQMNQFLESIRTQGVAIGD